MISFHRGQTQQIDSTSFSGVCLALGSPPVAEGEETMPPFTATRPRCVRELNSRHSFVTIRFSAVRRWSHAKDGIVRFLNERKFGSTED